MKNKEAGALRRRAREYVEQNGCPGIPEWIRVARFAEKEIDRERRRANAEAKKRNAR